MDFLYFLEGIRTDFFNKFFSIITHLGDETLLIVILVFIYWCVDKKQAQYLMFLTFLGTAVNCFLKLLFHVPRPWIKDPNFTIVESARTGANGYSFPSGHTQSVVSYMGGMALWNKNKIFRFFMVLGIALVSFSRMYLGVHTPADVIFSLIIGLVMLFAVYPIFKKSEKNISKAYIALIILIFTLLVVMEFMPLPMDYNKETLGSIFKNIYMVLGGSLAMLLSWYIDKKYINFDTRAVWWMQILKLVFGLAFLIGIKTFSKPLFESLFSGHYIATSVRYFFVILFAGIIWPMAFNYVSNIKKS